MKNDWAFQLAMVIGIVAMAVTALTYDHDKADRRDALGRVLAEFESRGLYEFDTWRSSSAHIGRAPDAGSELAWFGRRLADATALDRPAAEGILWYWLALRVQTQEFASPERRATYHERLDRAIGGLRASSIDASTEPSLRYLHGHYLGRSLARREAEPEAARRALRAGLEDAAAIRRVAGGEDAYRHVRTLANSFERLGGGPGMDEAVRVAADIYIEHTQWGFDETAIRGGILSGHEEPYERGVLEVMVPMMESWLEAHGPRKITRRNWYALGQTYDRLLDAEADAKRAWGHAEALYAELASSSGSADDLYMHASTLALIGELDRAVDRLDEAVDAGFDEFWRLRRHPSFRELRNDERFESIADRCHALYLSKNPPLVVGE